MTSWPKMKLSVLEVALDYKPSILLPSSTDDHDMTQIRHGLIERNEISQATFSCISNLTGSSRYCRSSSGGKCARHVYVCGNRVEGESGACIQGG
jgi:hypothetical protein